MKRVYIAAALFAMVIALCVFSSLRLQSIYTELDRRIDEISALAGRDDEKALELLDEMKSELESHESFFIAFLRRDYYYELRRLITAVPEDDVAQGSKTVKEQVNILNHAWFYLI